MQKVAVGFSLLGWSPAIGTSRPYSVIFQKARTWPSCYDWVSSDECPHTFFPVTVQLILYDVTKSVNI